jgi:hypothetical protein
MHTLPTSPASGISQPDYHALPESIARPTNKFAEEAAVPFDANRPSSSTNQFHGPTSATFDALPQNGRGRIPSAAIPEIYQKAQLNAETAKQRTFPHLPIVCIAGVT